MATIKARKTSEGKPRMRDATRIGAVFGAVKGTAPLIGWMLGSLASGFIHAADHLGLS